MDERKRIADIKEALLCISGVPNGCERCPYFDEEDCMGAAAADALDLIEELAAEEDAKDEVSPPGLIC